jgi:hypothetical protein
VRKNIKKEKNYSLDTGRYQVPVAPEPSNKIINKTISLHTQDRENREEEENNEIVEIIFLACQV